MVILEANRIHAVRDPYGFRPLCLGRFGTEDAPEGWIVASESPALDVVGADVRSRDRAGRDGDDHRSGRHVDASCSNRRRASRSSASSSSSTSLVPTRTSWVTRCTRRAVAWASCSPQQSSRRGRPRDGRARLGDAGRRGIRQGLGDSLRLRAREEPLHRPHVHRARPERARDQRATQVQSAAREHRGSAPHRRGRLDRARHDDARRSSRCCATPARPRCTFASPRRPSCGPATTASTRRIATSSRRANHSIEEMNEFIGSDSLEFITLENLRSAIRTGRRVLRRVSHRLVSGADPGHDRTQEAAGESTARYRRHARPTPRRASRSTRATRSLRESRPASASTVRARRSRGHRRLRRALRARAANVRRAGAGRLGRRRGHEARSRSTRLSATTRSGIDLVAMLVDDLVCVGAEPLFVLGLRRRRLARVPSSWRVLVAGVAEGCRHARGRAARR